MSTIASLSKRVIALQEEYACLLKSHESIKLDLSVLPSSEEQEACRAFLASIEDRLQ
jgi:hypothetical protein